MVRITRKQSSSWYWCSKFFRHNITSRSHVGQYTDLFVFLVGINPFSKEVLNIYIK